jgi:hypothetical protein
MSLVAGSINVELNAAVQDFIKGFDQAIAKVDKMADKSESLGQKSLNKLNSGLENTANLMKTGLLVGLGGAVTAFGFLGKTAVDNAGQFETFRSTLKVMLGTQELANQRLQEYSDIGKKTPFELPQVVALGNQLQSLGKYSKDNVMMLGDLASAAGKPIDQVSGAFAKLATGQKGVAVDMFRDLLITTDDWTKATGKGVSKSGELMATTEEMMAVLPKIMKDKKFIGMMDEQSKTFIGKMSNLMDTFNQKLVEVGDKLLPHIKPVIDKLVEVINSVDVDGMFKSFSNLFNLLYKGDFTGGFFGLDQNTINTIILVRDKLTEFGNYWGTEIQPKINAFLKDTWDKLLLAFNDFKDNILPNILKDLKKFGDWITENKATIENWAIVIGGIAAGFGLVSTALWLWNAAILAYNVVMGIGATITTFFGTAIALVTSPLFLIALAIGAVIAIGFLLWKNWDFLIAKATEFGKFAGEWLANKVKEAGDGIKRTFNGIGEAITNTFNTVKDTVGKVFGSIANFIIDGLRPAYKLLQDFRNSINGKEILGMKISLPELPELPQFATGINNFKGGMALVGEKGPEVVELPQGSKVNANAQSKNMGNTTNIMNYILQQDSYSSLRLQRV